MTSARVGLALIARNEEQTLPTLLASVTGAFDRVVLLDTGSTDHTIEIFEAWARETSVDHQVGHFEWRHDFAAARNTADQLLAGDGQVDWLCWADCDDVIHGAHHLRTLANQAPPELAAYTAAYDYAQDEYGHCICTLRRERLIRAGRGGWHGRVHEAQQLDGPVQHIDAGLVEWRHRKPAEHAGVSNARNLRILRSWLKTEPANPRVLMYLGTEELGRGRHDKAIPYLRRYLKLKSGWDEERAQVHRKLAIAYATDRRHQDAIDTALQAVHLLPAWPDSYLTLAEAYYELRDLDKAIHWARRVLELGVPDTMLIINPADYRLQPHVILAAAHGAQGDIEVALEHADQVLQHTPDHPALAPAAAGWRAARKREHTAATVIALAELLVAHDEQLKAAQVLDAVPYYAFDHPDVVDMRSRLRERLAPLTNAEGYTSFYTDGGIKPEWVVPDDQIDELCAILPRAGFLLDGLMDMGAAA